ncbi:tRNA lysidine(34) synthetase TilS [Pseudomonas mosselii]|uniref:tRNA lysidine(34) synthetase TilS n=1 Tax=Pseudomonas mosselii TaxID=78327 RepID=UPI0018D89C67|nr:tRNA lysidine(34) synthetase TilS [Pseudomonas mosselii]MBH3307867.1 tRNA lysidine(34) synthetase TilS [Pseudomonas mosselii]MBH3323053.1 tRNA lysidine(34) synthetase TilS [Pseudomonas mosselii]MCU9527684.1 tRNA lysidine(34) synthetase TilS [Pseudomonas mosselii]MCU9536292.1 tRNA lysidine(34) synthetase TilS [Pseudomonas mosselii]MCU9540828.1 tRNA lysidine(34) synthetase TilS [Pseudomonas mosselii]
MLNLTPWLNAPAWYVAFSGGLDSTVLLHQLADYTRNHPAPPLRAIHVHHGLQAAADAWPDHCRAVCAALGVELDVLPVQVAPGASLEQAARNARYDAFEKRLGLGEVLFTGQHRDDQAETLLFRLLRGAGLRGLSAMPQQRPLGQGSLVRPLLGLSRQQLQTYADMHGLVWVDDPSNSDTAFARNFLRGEVFPILRQRWPQAEANLARSAEHLGEAMGLLDELAASDLAIACDNAPLPWLELYSLSLEVLAAMSPARQRNALQFWLSQRTRLPDSRHWAGWNDLRDAAADACPVWRLTDGELHRSHGRIWWLDGVWLAAVSGNYPWLDSGQPLRLPGNGSVRLMSAPLGEGLHIRYRQGGEIMQLPGRGRRDLKRLLNELQVPHFVRPRLPLLYRGEQLLAVANLPELAQADCLLHWQPPTNVQGLS